MSSGNLRLLCSELCFLPLIFRKLFGINDPYLKNTRDQPTTADEHPVLTYRSGVLMTRVC